MNAMREIESTVNLLSSKYYGDESLGIHVFDDVEGQFKVIITSPTLEEYFYLDNTPTNVKKLEKLSDRTGVPLAFM